MGALVISLIYHCCGLACNGDGVSILLKLGEGKTWSMKGEGWCVGRRGGEGGREGEEAEGGRENSPTQNNGVVGLRKLALLTHPLEGGREREGRGQDNRNNDLL